MLPLRPNGMTNYCLFMSRLSRRKGHPPTTVCDIISFHVVQSIGYGRFVAKFGQLIKNSFFIDSINKKNFILSVLPLIYFDMLFEKYVLFL